MTRGVGLRCGISGTSKIIWISITRRLQSSSPNFSILGNGREWFLLARTGSSPISELFFPNGSGSRLWVRSPWISREDRSTVLRRVSERLLQKEKEEISRQIQELKERAPQNGLATFGLNGTLEALNGGQVRTLYLLTSFSQLGGKCSRCSALVLAPPSGDRSLPCPLCKGVTKRVDLGEESMKSVLRQDGEVKWLEENAILSENEGVAASLRFRLSR